MPDESSFDKWNPRDYLAEYFGEVHEDERPVIRYFAEQMKSAAMGEVLFFGCGPVLSQVFLAAPYATRIVLADYLHGNLAETEA